MENIGIFIAIGAAVIVVFGIYYYYSVRNKK